MKVKEDKRLDLPGGVERRDCIGSKGAVAGTRDEVFDQGYKKFCPGLVCLCYGDGNLRGHQQILFLLLALVKQRGSLVMGDQHHSLLRAHSSLDPALVLFHRAIPA